MNNSFMQARGKIYRISIIILIFIIVGCFMYYCFAPFFYCGSFDANEYAQKIYDYQRFSETKELETSGNYDSVYDVFKVYTLASNICRNRISYMDRINYAYSIYFDAEKDYWYIHVWNRFYMINDILYEGDSIIINSNGDVLAMYIG